MAKTAKKKITHPRHWGVKEVVQDLLEHGAKEIPKGDWKKEPFKTYLKSIRKNGKLAVD